VEDKAMICGKCGKEIPEGAVFCGWCGERCGEKICKACGTRLRSDELFCHECGVRWGGGAVQTTEQPMWNTAASGGINRSAGRSSGGTDSGKNLQRLTVCRLRQNTGSDNWYCWVKAMGERKVVKAGETLYYNIPSDAAVQVQIMYFKGTSPIATGGVKMLVTLASMRESEFSFGMSGQKAFRDRSTGIVYPQIEIVASQAMILQQSQDMFTASN